MDIPSAPKNSDPNNLFLEKQSRWWPGPEGEKWLWRQLLFNTIAAALGGAVLASGANLYKHIISDTPSSTSIRSKKVKTPTDIESWEDENSAKTEDRDKVKEAQYKSASIFKYIYDTLVDAYERIFGGSKPQILPSLLTVGGLGLGGYVGYKLVDRLADEYRNKEREKRIQEAQREYMNALGELASLGKTAGAEYTFAGIVDMLTDEYFNTYDRMYKEAGEKQASLISDLAAIAAAVAGISYIATRLRLENQKKSTKQRRALEELKRRRMLAQHRELVTLGVPSVETLEVPDSSTSVDTGEEI